MKGNLTLGEGMTKSLTDEPALEIRQPRGGVRAYALSFPSIMETGDATATIQITPEGPKNITSLTIDFKANDPVTGALATVQEQVEQRLQKEKTFGDVPFPTLLQHPHWSQEDRFDWEQKLAKLITEETAKIPGLDKYRSFKEGAQDIQSLNELAPDITNGSRTKRWDCFTQSIFKGIVAQRIENHLLPATGPAHEWHRAQSYFLIPGFVAWDQRDTDFSSHASILTPLGNMIEAAADNTPPNPRGDYIISPHTLQTLVGQDKPYISPNSNFRIYGYWGNKSPKALQKERTALEDVNLIDMGDVSLQRLQSEVNQEGNPLFVSPQGEFAFYTRRSFDGEQGLFLYQKQMIGTPREAYAMVAYAIQDVDFKSGFPGLLSPISATFKDEMNGKTYQFGIKHDDKGALVGKFTETTRGMHQEIALVSALDPPPAQAPAPPPRRTFNRAALPSKAPTRVKNVTSPKKGSLARVATLNP